MQYIRVFVGFVLCFYSDISCGGRINVTNRSLCRIQGNEADCSGHKTLNYIPDLPTNITVLRFSFNSLPRVTSKTFANVTKLRLTTLHLVGNHIKVISRKAFRVLRYLKYLDISHNNIDPGVLTDAFVGLATTPVTRLDMLAMSLRFIPQNFFNNLNDSRITYLHLHQNYFTYFNCSDFYQLKHLIHLGISQNLITDLLVSGECTLKEVDLSYNSVKYLCTHRKTFKSIELLNIRFNGIYHIDPSTLKCFPNIKTILLGGNYFLRIPQYTFAALTKLERLSMDINPTLKRIEEAAFSNGNVKKLIMKNNGVTLETESFNRNMFSGCSNLTYLDLSNNNCRHVSSDVLRQLLKPLKNSLQTLVMSDCTLTTIPEFVSSLTHLTQLHLYNNIITGWSSDILTKLTSLEVLDLSRNSISVVHENSLPENILKTLKTIDISYNPIDCSCANFWFLQIFQEYSEVFTNSSKFSKCSSPAGRQSTPVINIRMSENSCPLNLTSQAIVVVTSCLFLLIVVTGTLVYRYRWHLRYLLYMRNNVRLREQPEENDDQYLYDVFVVYSSDDSDWVLDKVLPQLEGGSGLRLCVHERNFEAGRLIIDNVMASIDSSKKVMLVLSNSFSERDWCQFELDVIHRRVLAKGRHLVVTVVLEELDNRRLTPSMLAMLETTTYIRWTDNPDAEDGFWENLVHALR